MITLNYDPQLPPLRMKGRYVRMYVQKNDRKAPANMRNLREKKCLLLRWGREGGNFRRLGMKEQNKEACLQLFWSGYHKKELLCSLKNVTQNCEIRFFYTCSTT